jgi:phosphoenolpyruvate carboxykinase (diphosphate)
VDHDISLLIPEIWTRLGPRERDPAFLIAHGYLEKLEDFDHRGRRVLAGRLGYRITAKFVHDFFGRVFDNPTKVFDDAILRPETQDLETFVDGVNNIVEAQQRVASGYFEDGGIDALCPPLRAVVEIMAGRAERGPAAESPALRSMFTREYLLGSDWYRERLAVKQRRDEALWSRHVTYLEQFLARASHRDVADRMDLAGRLRHAKQQLADTRRPEYPERLLGTIGADPLGPPPARAQAVPRGEAVGAR